MRPDRHVVVVSLDTNETHRWEQAADIALRGELEKRGYSLHVLDCGAPSAAGTLRLMLERRFAGPSERAARLDRALADPPFMAPRSIEDPEITLVGCGRACQVIKRFAVDRLRARATSQRVDLGDVRSVRRVRQIVLINAPGINLLWVALVFAALLGVAPYIAEYLAAPAQGAGVAASAVPWVLVKIVSGILAAIMTFVVLVLSSEEVQRRLDVDLSHIDASLARQFRDAVEQGAKAQSGSWPIPTQTLTMWGNVQAHPDALARLVMAVTRPPAHPNLYDVDQFERRITIRPARAAEVLSELRQLARVLRKEHTLEDNEADYLASVTFSGMNEHQASSRLRAWILRYGTSDGLLHVDPIHQNNLWEPQNIAHYARHRDLYQYKFLPEASRTYALTLRVYGGYTGEEQRSHCHLRADTYYWRVREVLDLSAYLATGWELPTPPKVWYRRRPLPRVATNEPKAERDGLSFECTCRQDMDSVPYEVVEVAARQDEKGVFSWEIQGVRDGGVLEFQFQLARGTHGQQPSDRSAAGIA